MCSCMDRYRFSCMAEGAALLEASVHRYKGCRTASMTNEDNTHAEATLATVGAVMIWKRADNLINGIGD